MHEAAPLAQLAATTVLAASALNVEEDRCGVAREAPRGLVDHNVPSSASREPPKEREAGEKQPREAPRNWAWAAARGRPGPPGAQP